MENIFLSISNWIVTNLVTVIGWFIIIALGVIPKIFGKKKRIEFHELWKGQVIDVTQGSQKNKLEIKYLEHIVTKLSTYTFRVKNIGTSIIEKKDFIDNHSLSLLIEFDSNEEGQIIAHEITDSTSISLSASLECSYDRTQFSIKPFNLNPGEFFEIRVIVDGEIRKGKVDLRIKSTKLIQLNYKRRIIIVSIVAILLLLLNYGVTILNKILLGDDKKSLWSSENYVNPLFQTIIIGVPVIIVCIYVYLVASVIRLKGWKRFLRESRFKGNLKDLFRI